jgi:hypothetical protein
MPCGQLMLRSLAARDWSGTKIDATQSGQIFSSMERRLEMVS